MKTLIIAAHSDITKSVVNKRWIMELEKYPEKYTVHELSSSYPNGKIDVEKEQRLVEEHGNLILQFPIYWFSGPPILKKWLDEVLTYGWAYGRNGGDKLANRKIALAVTAGIRKEDYEENGRYRYTLEQLLAPYETTFRYYCHADYRSLFAFYSSEIIPGEEYTSTAEEIEKSAKDYLNFISGI